MPACCFVTGGSLGVSEEGYVYWSRGTLWFVQFKDNVLLAYNLPPFTCTTLVQEVWDALSDIWGLEILCNDVNSGQFMCHGKCLT